MAKVKLNVNVDEELKKEVLKVLDIIGIDMTTAINIYLQKIVNLRQIPFKLTATQYISLEDVMGPNWREEVEDLDDDWE